MCSTHYWRSRVGNDLEKPIGWPPAEERFLAKVNKNGPNGCWLWLASVHARYGYFGYGYYPNGKARVVRAHRWAFEHWVRPLADGEFVLHRCDVPLCVNPAHLFAGTHADNMADMVAKGRNGKARGAANGNAKLATEQVTEIRQRYAAGGVTQPQLAAEYGVSVSCVGCVIRRETHVDA